jgi:site-specific DNA recombinase
MTSTNGSGRRELQPGDIVDIYVRVSRDEEDDKLAVKRQEEACRDLCKHKRWKVGIVHQDNDKSAYSGKVRPAYEELLRRVQNGHVRGLVAWHPDRLHRSTKELERFIDIVEASGIGVATVQGGDYDLTTASGRMSARIVGAVARHHSEHKSEQLREKMIQLKKSGKFTGAGRRPYGYEFIKTKDGKLDRLVLREDEALIIRELVRRYIGGESLLSLVRDLNARGVKAATGGAWGLASVSRLLRAPRIAGLRDVEGKLKPAPWDGIITAHELRQLRTLLARNHKAGTRAQRSYLLTGGLVVCGSCKKPMIGRPINGKPTYGCDKARGGCGSVWVRAENVDAIVHATVVEVVDKPGLAKRLQRGSGKDPILDDIERQEKRLREAEEDYGAGEMERDEYRRIRAHAKDRLEDLRKNYQPATSIDYGSENPLSVAWPLISLGRRRAVLDAVLKSVKIMPVGHRKDETFKKADRFQGERVKLTWKV